MGISANFVSTLANAWREGAIDPDPKTLNIRATPPFRPLFSEFFIRFVGYLARILLQVALNFLTWRNSEAARFPPCLASVTRQTFRNAPILA